MYSGVAVDSEGKYLFSVNGRQATLQEWFAALCPGLEKSIGSTPVEIGVHNSETGRGMTLRPAR